MKLVVQIKPTAEIVKRLGLNPGGKVQKFWTQRCAACISKYLPYRTANSFGAALDRGISPDGTKITIDLPYARYLYYGKLMVGEKTGSAYARADEKRWLPSRKKTWSIPPPTTSRPARTGTGG